LANLEQRFDELALYLNDQSSRRHLAMLVYPPPVERRVVTQLPEFISRLQQGGLRVHLIDINRLVNEQISSRLDEVIDLWKTDRGEVTSFIAERAGGVIRSATRGANADVVIWTRVGGAYPFLRVASVMEDLIGKLDSTLLVLYPGFLEDKTRFRLLDERDGYQYRAHFLRTVDE
jgi:hypothetical protein